MFTQEEGLVGTTDQRLYFILIFIRFILKIINYLILENSVLI